MSCRDVTAHNSESKFADVNLSRCMLYTTYCSTKNSRWLVLVVLVVLVVVLVLVLVQM